MFPQWDALTQAEALPARTVYVKPDQGLPPPPKLFRLFLGAHFTVCYKAFEIGLKSLAALPLKWCSLNVSAVLPKRYNAKLKLGLLPPSCPFSFLPSLCSSLPPFLSQLKKIRKTKNTELNTLLRSSSKEVFLFSFPKPEVYDREKYAM